MPVNAVESKHQFLPHHAMMREEEDSGMLRGLIEAAQARYPGLAGCSFDKGFSSPSKRRRLDETLRLNAMLRKGRLSKADRERGSAPDCVAARRNHAAVESAFNNLEQRGFDRVLAHGPDGFARMVALWLVSANMHRIGVILQRRARERLKRESLVRAAWTPPGAAESTGKDQRQGEVCKVLERVVGTLECPTVLRRPSGIETP